MVAEFIVAFVAAVKAFNQLSVYFNLLVAEWIKYDIDRIGGEAASKKEEFEVFNALLKKSTNDSERRVLLRSLNRFI